LLGILLNAANKAVADQTDAEKGGLAWLATKIRNNRISEKSEALSRYQYCSQRLPLPMFVVTLRGLGENKIPIK
jgi:hypothetical protein